MDSASCTVAGNGNWGSEMRVLVVEDEPRLAELIRDGLVEEGHAADVAATGNEVFSWVRVVHYDAILLDRMLPDKDGIEICRALRQQGVRVPILMLTARDAVEDRVAGLDAGADDYLVKPFSLVELHARIRALSRRPTDVLDPVLMQGELRLDPAARRVWRGDQEISLPNKEFRILEYLMRNAGRVLTREMIANHVWDYEFLNATNVIDVHVRMLRERLGDPVPGGMIQTVRGAGYRISTSP
jgi:two-component system OmpR family response regulator